VALSRKAAKQTESLISEIIIKAEETTTGIYKTLLYLYEKTILHA
jgi:hypothetical protein